MGFHSPYNSNYWFNIQITQPPISFWVLASIQTDHKLFCKSTVIFNRVEALTTHKPTHFVFPVFLFWNFILEFFENLNFSTKKLRFYQVLPRYVYKSYRFQSKAKFTWDELFIKWCMQLRHPNISVDLNLVSTWPDQFKMFDNTKNYCSTIWQHEKTKIYALLYLSKKWQGGRLWCLLSVKNWDLTTINE